MQYKPTTAIDFLLLIDDQSCTPPVGTVCPCCLSCYSHGGHFELTARLGAENCKCVLTFTLQILHTQATLTAGALSHTSLIFNSKMADKYSLFSDALIPRWPFKFFFFH